MTLAAETMQPGDRIPMSWNEYEALGSDVRGDAAAGVERYWIVDPEGPDITVYQLVDGVFAERGVHTPGTEVTLDVDPAEVTFDPAQLLD